jgi:hypothetical protein
LIDGQMESERTASVKPIAKFAVKLVKALWVAGLVSAFALSFGGHVYSEELAGGQPEPGAIRKISRPIPASPSVHGVPAPRDFREKANYVRELNGYRSLSIATEVEQPGSGLVHYLVRLHLDSSREQSIDVMAPPGGLEPEVRDMTGDNTRNDLLLTPAMFCWPPIVLVNDEHDHFAVAISGAIPDSMSSREELTSRTGNAQGAAGLISSGFKVGGPLPRRGLVLPQFQGSPLLAINGVPTVSPDYASNSGRAPPSFVTSI